ncbi:hypothetical protein RUND412_001781 [Rhizina undulata]
MPSGSVMSKKKAPTFPRIAQYNALPSTPYVVSDRGGRKVIFLGGASGRTVVVEKRRNIEDWTSYKSPGLTTCDGEAVGQMANLDSNFNRIMDEEGGCFSASSEGPDAKFLKPLGLPVDNIMPAIPLRKGSNSMIRPSLPTFTTKDSDQEIPVPKHYDGTEVLLPKAGIEGLDTAWKYDVFPLYVKEPGVYWDFREAFNHASEFGDDVDLDSRLH